VFNEIFRILSIKGNVLVSVPLLNPIHGDHWADRSRYTPVILLEDGRGVGLHGSGLGNDGFCRGSHLRHHASGLRLC